MPAKKRPTTTAASNRKRTRDEGDNVTTSKNHPKTTTVSSSSKVSSSWKNVTKSQQTTAYGVVVLLVAIAMGMWWNSSLSKEVDPSIASFWQQACSHSSFWCGRIIRPTRRTLQAARPIRVGETLVEIPRTLQLWELDAIRSDVVREERLLEARHELTQHSLAGGAFLAVHLALEHQRLIGMASNETLANGTLPLLSKEDQAWASYFASLPTFEELKDTHPILMDRSELKSMLGHHSWNFVVVIMYQEMVQSEYQALTSKSALFAAMVSKEQYQTSRIHVLTRSFNPGPSGCLGKQEHLMPNEQEAIEMAWGVEKGALFTDGCHSIVPILDMLNHHPQPNVAYQFDTTKQAFVVSAKTKIPVGWELMDSYGMYSDSHLFAKFGFINGDGSGFTQASIAVFHRPLDVQMKNEFTLMPRKIMENDDDREDEQAKNEDDKDDGIFSLADGKKRSKLKIPEFQKPELKRYLQYDDGYQDCVEKDKHPDAFKLKQLKWYHLSKIANNPKSWVALLSPRSPASKPRESSDMMITDVVPQVDPRITSIELSRLVNTCRLLALTTDDYDGNAIQVLKENMKNSSFVVEGGNTALEYRALMFLYRLASTALIQYQTSPKEAFNLVVKLNQENSFPGKNWTAAHLRLAEMQSLLAITGVAFSHAKKWEADAKKDSESGSALYIIREKSCPSSFSDLIDEDGLFE
ncbi:SET methyltransferase domain containing protein [Nitzschia inconspicua]|uniref:SET methyltransferase domain containing protein n=1 Tax=Nitzschia inconspicua TaxID=303405 RepID=A0A9K3KUJ8_9STRA|nr:SET methyltransferase domain containing protein [Nitzschia inconspicua]